MMTEHDFLLQRIQPAMVGLIDGSLSTLAPIFGVALATQNPRDAFVAGLVTPIGAPVARAAGRFRRPAGGVDLRATWINVAWGRPQNPEERHSSARSRRGCD